MIDRNYMIQRLTSKPMTLDEFNYESMTAPPISSMFTQEDIMQLNYIAISPKYSSKLDEKYKLINDILENRGFEKYVAGTNRVSYIPKDSVLANIFIIKIPYTRAAMEDNIREYQNQFLIKPFCTKVFEVTPCGTIGLFEKVRPITHTDEYLSIADDIYELLSEFLIGEYVIDDIGTNYFMNIGVRSNFGPVLLDFPYVYKVDQKRLYCWAKDNSNPTGYCNGEIDYDPGFNYLYCKKCNCRYKPYELGQRIQYEEKIIKGKGELDMKIRITGGSKNRNEEIITGDFRNPVNSIKSNLLNRKVEKQVAEEKEKVKTVNGISAAREDVDDVVEIQSTKEEDTVEEEDISKDKVDEIAEQDDASGDKNNEVEEKKELKSPFTIDESLIDSRKDPGYESKEEEEDIYNEIGDMGKYLAKIVNLYFYSDSSAEDKKVMATNLAEFLVDIFADNIKESLKMFSAIIKKKKNIKDEITKEFLDTTSCSFKDQILKLLFKSGEYNIDIDIDTIEVNNISEDINKNFTASIVKTKNNQVISKYDGSVVLNYDIDTSLINNSKEIDLEEENEDNNPNNIDYFKISIIDQKTLFPQLESSKVIVLKDNDGKYLTIDKSIVAANKIGENYISDVEVISKDWVNNAKKLIKNIKPAPVGTFPKEEEEEVDEEE